MMRKINFTIVDASTEADGHGCRNLEHQHPTSPGWQSQKFCSYPQEITVHLSENCQIKKFQILSHQFMISSKVEFFIAAEESPKQFVRLGYVHLSNNELNNFKSRELKSVHVDVEGQFLKLVFHRNHNNKLNVYHQVGVVAFNVLGEPLGTPQPPISFQNQPIGLPGKSPEKIASKSDEVSHLDDLLFDMYMDSQVLAIIRVIDDKKRRAIAEEDYDTAKNMKIAIDEFHEIGEKLARHEMEKQHAVESEDFDLAKSLKFQIDELRLKISQHLQKHNLFDEFGHLTKEETLQRAFKTPRETSTAKVDSQTSPILQYTASSIPTGTNQIESADFDNTPSEKVPHDEKIIPTLDKHRHSLQPDSTMTELSSSSIDGLDDSGPLPSEPETLSDQYYPEAKPLIDIFGLSLVTEAYSKHWHFRVHALQNLNEQLLKTTDSLSKDQIRDYLRMTTLLVDRRIKDPVYAVHRAALKVLETILIDYIPRHKLGKLVTTNVIAHTLPILVQKTGETTPRSRASAVEFIVRMSDFETVRRLRLVSNRLLSPIKKDTSHWQALSRVEMVKQLLLKHGFNDDSLSLDSVMTFALAALEHASGPVREDASKLVFLAYRLAGPCVRTYFPLEDDEETIHNTLLKQLLDGFNEIDGRKKSRRSAQSKKPRQRFAEKLKKVEEHKNQLESVQSLVNLGKETQRSNDSERRKRNRASKKLPEDRPEKVFVTPHPKPSAKFETLVYRELSDSSGDDVTLERTCIFCGEKDDSFTEDGLDFHYWKHCPMLKRCLHCKQVVEICNFSEHLLTECDGKEKFKFCPRCSEAILKVDYERHVTSKKCAVLQPNIEEHCPLCHENINAGDESWQRHLMGSKIDACTENPRRQPSLKRRKAKLARNTHTTE